MKAPFLRLLAGTLLPLLAGSARAAISYSLGDVEIDSPAFVIDADEFDGNPGTNRHRLLGSAKAGFSRSALDPAISGSFKVRYHVLDSAGDKIDLNVGGATQSFDETAPFSVNLSGFNFSQSVPLTLAPDPAGTLDPDERYTLAGQLYRWDGVKWVPVAGASDASAPEPVLHFTNTTSPDPSWNILGTITELKWNTKYMLQSGTPPGFLVTAEAYLGRFDDFDQPAAQVTSKISWQYELIATSSGTSIPLLFGGSQNGQYKPLSYTIPSGDPLPDLDPGISHVFQVIPLQQLDSVNETYELRLTLSYENDAGGTTSSTGTLALPPEQLLHFNGTLTAGGDIAAFSEIANIPAPGASGLGYVETQIQIPAGKGSLPGNAALDFGSSVPVTVRLKPNGDAQLVGGSYSVTLADSPADPLTGTLGSQQVEYGAITLEPLGLVTDSVRLAIPQGTVLMTSKNQSDTRRGLPYYDFSGPGIALDGAAALDEVLTEGLSADANVVSEEFPLTITATSIELTPGGVLSFGQAGVEYLHDAAMTRLENDAAAGNFDDPAMAERPSNDGYYRLATGFADTTVWITIATDGSSRLNGRVELDDGSFKPHFPVDSEVSWTGTTSTLVLEDGRHADGSFLSLPESVSLDYYSTCENDGCATPGAGLQNLNLLPWFNQTPFVTGGGILIEGQLDPSAALKWGARGDGAGGTLPPAHETDSIDFVQFYMPGHHLYALDNTTANIAWTTSDAHDAAPGLLLDSCSDYPPIAPVAADLNLYGSEAYIEGIGLFAGINVDPVPNDHPATSRPGGTAFAYELEGGQASKYYVRLSGVSGRTVAVEGSWGPAAIYGYPFEFDRFQLTFLSSEPEDSWIDGSLEVDGATTFTQSFLGLMLNCTGDLEDAGLDPNDLDDKPLIYWNGGFTARTVRFAKGDAVCATPPAKLVLGASLSVANIPTQLHGELGFEPDGRLTTIETAFEGVDSRLSIPSRVTYAGPNATDYSLVPVGKLWFNDPADDPNYDPGNPAGGFVTFGATINVPYFQDLQVQAVTFASPEGSLYLCGDWTEDGKTVFSHPAFDPSHKGWPSHDIDLAEFLSPSSSTNPDYLVAATQNLFGLVPLTYPLRWDPNAAFFESMSPENDDILVATLEHQVDYLDAKFADISFGIEYDGLPQLSLTHVLNSQINGVSQKLADELTGEVKQAIDDGITGFDKVLDDTLEAALDPLFDKAATAAVAPLFEQLAQSYEFQRRINLDIEAGIIVGTPATYQDWVNNDVLPLLDTYLYNAGSQTGVLLDEINRIGDAADQTASIIKEVDTAVLGAIKAIDVLVNQVRMVEELNDEGELELVVAYTPDPLSIPDIDVRHGLIQEHVEGLGGEAARHIFDRLIDALLIELTPPDVAAILGPIITAGTGELNAEINALLEDVDPALDQLTVSLNQVRGTLVEIHNSLQQGGDLVGEFQSRVNNAQTELRTIASEIEISTREYLDLLRLSANMELTAELHVGIDLFVDASLPGDIGDLAAEQFIAHVRGRVRDAILESELVRGLKFQVRHTLYDIENRVISSINSIFARASEVMTDAVKSTLGELEESINPLIGKAGDYLGSGEIQGRARINGDSLRQLRLDGNFEFKVPDELQVHAYLEINVVTAEDNFTDNGCISPGQKAVEVKIGATDVGLDWLSDGLRAELVELRISLKDFVTDPFDFPVPNGAGGSFIIGGDFDFEAVSIHQIRATFGFAVDFEDPGNSECFIGGGASVTVSSYEASGAVFFGRTCTLAPLELVDPDVAEVVGPMPFTGAYVYGECWLPISEIVLGVPASCMFRISAGIGVGAFLNIEGPTLGGKMLAGVSGEALCVVSIKGTVKMAGSVNTSGDLRYAGTGTIKGKAGACPFCLKFKKSVKITYLDGDWGIDL